MNRPEIQDYRLCFFDPIDLEQKKAGMLVLFMPFPNALGAPALC